MTQEKLNVAIIGGGVVGLILALSIEALNLDIDYTLFESRTSINDVGASLTFSGYASETLFKIGLKPLLEKIGYGFRERKYRDWKTGEVVLDGFVRKKSYAVHRNEFVKELFKLLPSNKIVLGKKFKKYELNDGVDVEFDDGQIFHTDLLIGADGIHSKIRSQIVKYDDDDIFSGFVMYRGILDIRKIAPINYELTNVTLSFSPDQRSLVNIPIRQGNYYSVSATFPYDSSDFNGKEHSDLWHIDTSTKRIVEKLEGFNENHVKLYESLEWINGYGLFYKKRLDNWIDKNVALVGDAAHAMLPHIGQGGSTGVEDAYALAITLNTALSIDNDVKSNIEKWLLIYQRLRLSAANKVHLSAELAGILMHEYHLTEKGVELQKNGFYPKDLYEYHDYESEIKTIVYDVFGKEYFFKLL